MRGHLELSGCQAEHRGRGRHRMVRKGEEEPRRCDLSKAKGLVQERVETRQETDLPRGTHRVNTSLPLCRKFRVGTCRSKGSYV